MIIEDFHDAAIVVNAQKSMGKRIGWMAMEGTPHAGHLALAKTLKANCDFAICHAPLVARDAADTEYAVGTYWGVASPQWPLKVREFSTNAILEADYALLLTGHRPIPPIELKDEIKTFGEQYIQLYRQYDPIFMTGPRNAEDIIGLNSFAGTYYTTRYLFPFDVRVSSYKEGVRRLIDRLAWKQYLGIDVIFAPTVRDRDGLCISASTYMLTTEQQPI